MARTQVRSAQLGDAEVKRVDLNTTETGQAVITKIIAGSGVSLSSTGVDAGTGDVTINSAGGVDINSLTEKFALSLFDYFVIEDSEDSYNKKKVTVLTFLSALLTGFTVDGGDVANPSLVFVDGGIASSTYMANQRIDGGMA